MSASVLEHHLATCSDCARWEADAVRLTRRARVGTARVPDLADQISASVARPARRVLRRRALLRAALFVAGLVQLVIALLAIVGDSIGIVMSAHAAHETGAWNLALGVAFLATASRPRRAAGLIALLATFVVVLGALSAHDIANGELSIDHLSTHICAGLGLLLVLLLDRAERAMPPGRSSAGHRGATLGEDDGHGDLRGVA